MNLCVWWGSDLNYSDTCCYALPTALVDGLIKEPVMDMHIPMCRKMVEGGGIISLGLTLEHCCRKRISKLDPGTLEGPKEV